MRLSTPEDRQAASVKVQTETASGPEGGIQLLGDIEATTSVAVIHQAVREHDRAFTRGYLARVARDVVSATVRYVS